MKYFFKFIDKEKEEVILQGEKDARGMSRDQVKSLIQAEAMMKGVKVDDKTAFYMTSDSISAEDSIDKIINDFGLSVSRIGRRFGIPYRTVQNWKLNLRKCPDYVLRMIRECLKADIKEFGEVQTGMSKSAYKMLKS